AAPALSAAPEPNTNGSMRRASCHTGTAVLATRAAVYVDSGRASSAAAGLATRAARGHIPVHASAAASVVAAPLAPRIHDPTLLGEVTLTIRNMFMNRLGRPRSEIRNSGLTEIPASEAAQARRARTSLPRAPERNASPAEAPPSPPVKKYIGISHVQIGSLITGCPW